MAARIKPAGSTQAERDLISLGRIESYMDCLIKDSFQCPSCAKETPVKELNAGAVQLIRARYDKLRPSLSSVEQTVHNADDTLSEDAIMQKLAALVEAYPDLLQRILAAQARAKAEPVADAQIDPAAKSA